MHLYGQDHGPDVANVLNGIKVKDLWKYIAKYAIGTMAHILNNRFLKSDGTLIVSYNSRNKLEITF